MSKLKRSEWDPLSNGVFRVHAKKKTYLAVSRTRSSQWFSKKLLGQIKERDGYLFLEEPMVSNLAIFASEEFAKSVMPVLGSGEISRERLKARVAVESEYDNPEEYLDPCPPTNIDFLA